MLIKATTLNLFPPGDGQEGRCKNNLAGIECNAAEIC